MSPGILCLLTWASGSLPPVDFDTQVVPVLTVAGCNSGACHGAAMGQGGFFLSLWGGDPAADYEAIVRRQEGRRVNLVRPDASLLFRKPAGLLDHGGGWPLAGDSPGGRLLLRWLSEGAARRPARTLRHFTVEPATTMAAVGDSIPFRATAVWTDDQVEDVTQWTVFTPADPAALEVSGTADVLVRLRGRHTLVARFLDRIVPVGISVPLNADPVALDREPRHNFIDDEILATLADLRLPVSPQADDAAFLRRATLDLTGRLPKPEAVEQFLADDRLDKRDYLLDDLLASPAFVDYWTLWFARLLRLDSRAMDPEGAAALHAWLRRCLADRVPWDRMARDLIAATGDSHTIGPVNFSRATANPRDQAEHFSEAFMGVRLRCANCHNHPLDRWTQDDYHGLAATFARLERGRQVAWGPRGEVIHPRTGGPIAARLPGDGPIVNDGDPRSHLADWLIAPDNPYFARAMVNRLWKELFGRGLVDPVDDLRSTNPATHPELLDRLAGDFAAHGCDIRQTLRLIAHSAAYGRSTETLAGNERDDRFYSHAAPRPLSAEVLADALSDVLGLADAGLPPGNSAIELVDGAIEPASLLVLGRCSRNGGCDERAAAGDLVRTLHLLNGPLVNARIASAEGRLAQALAADRTDRQILNEFYLHALGRRPDRWERAQWLVHLGEAITADERRALWEDWLWALLNSREFASK